MISQRTASEITKHIFLVERWRNWLIRTIFSEALKEISQWYPPEDGTTSYRHQKWHIFQPSPWWRTHDRIIRSIICFPSCASRISRKGSNWVDDLKMILQGVYNFSWILADSFCLRAETQNGRNICDIILNSATKLQGNSRVSSITCGWVKQKGTKT